MDEKGQAESAWKLFETTGSVADYLSYVNAAHRQEADGEGRNHAAENQGNHIEASEHR